MAGAGRGERAERGSPAGSAAGGTADRRRGTLFVLEDDPQDDLPVGSSSARAFGYEPPVGRVVRMGNAPPRPASSLDTGSVSTTRFI